MTPHAHMSPIDLCIVVLYVTAILGVGVFSSRRTPVTSATFFLAGRSLPWGIVGSALFASNISTIHLVGLAASGYNEGLIWGNFEWMASLTLIILALVFAPFYFRNHIATLPEFLERRYSPLSRSILAIMAILAALFIHIGMSLYAGAIVFQEFFGVRVEVSILVVALLVSIYTILGGLKAVVMTETFNTIILLTGVIIITIFALHALPAHGIHSLQEFRSAVKPGQLDMLQRNSPAGLNWYAVFLGYPILGIWYWCTDQTIVQRVLGARTELDSQLGPLFAGFLKVLPVFFLILPGVIGYVLFHQQIGGNSNRTLPVLINTLIPVGLRGLIIAAVLAALMSAISAALNSAGTLVAVDVAKRIRPNLSDRQLVRIGRISSAIVMVLAIAWSTQGGRFESIFTAINIMAADLAPPITTVFLFGVFWRRGTKEASATVLLGGLLLGIVAFLVDLPIIGTSRLLTDKLGIPFLMQAWWMFCICSAVFVLTSLLTTPPPVEQLDGLIWQPPWKSANVQGSRIPMVVALCLFSVMVILYTLLR
jgi:solute:Na+ symporter, SSS family